jgi:hypothetical protein
MGCLKGRCDDSERRITFVTAASPENPLELARYAVVTGVFK